MAERWSEPISDRTIGKAVKKIGYSRKKKLTAIKKEMKKKDKNLSKRLVKFYPKTEFILMNQEWTIGKIMAMDGMREGKDFMT